MFQHTNLKLESQPDTDVTTVTQDARKQQKTELIEASIAVQWKYQHQGLVEDESTRASTRPGSQEVEVSQQLCEMETKIIIENDVRLAPKVTDALDDEIETEEQKCVRHCTMLDRQKHDEMEVHEMMVETVASRTSEKRKCVKPQTEEENARRRAVHAAYSRKHRKMLTDEQRGARNARRREKRAELKALRINRRVAVMETEKQKCVRHCTMLYPQKPGEMEKQEMTAQIVAPRAVGKRKCETPETEEEKARRRAVNAAYSRKHRNMLTDEQRHARKARDRERKAELKALRKNCVVMETEEQRTQRLMRHRELYDMKKAKWKSLLPHDPTIQSQQTETSSQPVNQLCVETLAMPQVHWLNVDASLEQSVHSAAVNDVTVDTRTPCDNSSELYVYKVDNIELACQLVEKQQKHVFIENSSTTAVVGDQLYPCKHCDKSFRSLTKREDHYHFDHPGLRCRRSKTSRCYICYFTSLSLDKMLNHMTDNHQNVNWKLFFCGICRKPFVGRGNFQCHYSVHMKQYKCPVCTKSFGSMACLQMHSVSHSSERSYRCEMCDKRFRHKCELSWHTSSNRTNSGKSTNVTLDGQPLCATFCRPYQCQYCDKCFTSPLGLRLHTTNRHTCAQRATYICQFCGQCFLNREGVQRHEDRKHLLTARKFKCEHCQEAFEIKRSLKVHLLAVHSDINIEPQDGDNPYNCPDCQQLFKDRLPLLKHIAINHT